MGEGTSVADDVAVWTDTVTEFAKHSMWKHGTPGLVLGVTDRDRTVFTAPIGYAEARARRPLTAGRLFQIGSVSKSFTCIALLQLDEEGVIDIHEPLKRYLPWFEVRTRFGDITLHHLMTHTAGVVMGTDATPTSGTEVWELRHTEATSAPGTYFHYSNSGYKALGLVLKAVTGQSYERTVKERVLYRAGMDSTEAVMTNETRDRLAVAHEPIHDDRPLTRRQELYPAPWFESDTADGTVCSPVEDMLSYIRTLMKGGAGPRGRVLTEESFRRMTTPYIHPDDGIHTGGYGYGLNIESVDGHTCIGHQGGMVGYYTSMLMDMDLGVGVMVMVNGPGEPEEVARFAMEALRNSSEGKPLPDVPANDDVFAVPGAGEYEGVYRDHDERLEVLADRAGLRVRCPRGEARLEPREGASFLADCPGLELFLLEFEKKDGRFDMVHHGARTYTREGAPVGDGPGRRQKGLRYEGHYRSHNPWLTNFRVASRRSGLVFIHPSGKSEPMTTVGEDTFRIGSDERSPERIRFECFMGGRADSATLSGGGRFGRTFTP